MIRGLKLSGRYLLAGASVIGILAASVSLAKAATLEELEAAIKVLQQQVKEAKAAAAAAQAAAANAGGSDLDLKVKWKGAPEFTSGDGKQFKFKVRGRLHTDYNAIDQDFEITGRPDVSAAELRRARLGVEGVVFYDVKYIVEVDFANDAVSVKDAYAEYTGLAEDLALRAGNFKTFNSLDQLNSSNYRTFLETPALVEAWGIDRQIGAAAIYAKDHYTLSAGIFGPFSANDERWLEDVKTGSARVTFAPINSDVKGVHQVVHFGASWRGREQAEDLRSPTGGTSTLNPLNDQFFQYRARGADLHLADRFVSTPAIFDRDNFWGLEALVIWKSFHVQAEYTQLEAEISPFFNGSDPTYTGWYVDAGWFITGETLPYNKGVFGRPKVKNPVVWSKGGGWGAWQLAARYDVLDLTDQATTIQGPNVSIAAPAGTSAVTVANACTLCGEQTTWIIGVNWWLNDYSRIMFQYAQSDIEGGNAPLVGNVAGYNRNDGATIKGFGTRFQVDW